MEEEGYTVIDPLPVSLVAPARRKEWPAKTEFLVKDEVLREAGPHSPTTINHRARSTIESTVL